MFRKLVSSLPFSPALVGQLGLYARRLSREQATRRLGLIFTLLALVVQSFALINPPEPTYAASPTSECKYSDTLTTNDPDCKACPYNSSVWINDPTCNKNLQLSIEAINLSRGGKPASDHLISPDDRIQYTVHTTNIGSDKATAIVEVSIRDLMEYATLTITGNGEYDTASQKLSWGSILLTSRQTDTRSFVITMNSSFPTTPQAVDDPSSYDCTLTATYGNTLNDSLSCPVAKEIENVVKQLPQTGAGENIIFSALVLIAAAYYYLRTKQMSKEMKVIRHEYNVG